MEYGRLRCRVYGTRYGNGRPSPRDPIESLLSSVAKDASAIVCVQYPGGKSNEEGATVDEEASRREEDSINDLFRKRDLDTEDRRDEMLRKKMEEMRNREEESRRKRKDEEKEERKRKDEEKEERKKKEEEREERRKREDERRAEEDDRRKKEDEAAEVKPRRRTSNEDNKQEQKSPVEGTVPGYRTLTVP
ncbi:hypothetical protein PMAYCL1PPCAC_05520 [Pristionchus mayeri]|uniref:Uncharacterized protein n=1 Tax=Pristionchus mayeri TaxID=1317129 RepID=A0AAN4Z704_9BILA|nr:hypothetical protein PMAYCL1PPCAC_05520 [Pristionchus mayeri]